MSWETLIPTLLPWADKITIWALILVIFALVFLMFLLARVRRAQTFPAAVPSKPVPPAPPVVPVQPDKPAPVVPDKPDKPSPVVPPVVVPAGSDFERCVAVTLRPDVEGGNDKAVGAPGSKNFNDRTSRGIEQIRDWDVWRETHPGRPADVFDAPQADIIAIYKEHYWNPLYCDSLPNGVDLVVFDHGVLAGIGTSAEMLQAIVGTDIDGEIGPLTIAAAAAMDPVSLTSKLCDARQAHYDDLVRKNPARNTKYIRGWTNRVVIVRTAALALAVEAPRPKLVTPATLDRKYVEPAPSGAIPPWLAAMRSLLGVKAGGDNPKIMDMVPAIADAFPDMTAYARTYTHDSIAWCGHSAAYCMAMAGIKPPSEYLLAASWATWGTAVANDDDVQPGDVIVWDWGSGFHHVTFYDHSVPADDFFWCCGGNQGPAHTVTVEPIKMAFRHAIRRPPA